MRAGHQNLSPCSRSPSGSWTPFGTRIAVGLCFARLVYDEFDYDLFSHDSSGIMHKADGMNECRRVYLGGSGPRLLACQSGFHRDDGLVDFISRTALAAVACPKTGANAHRLIVAIASSTKSTIPEFDGELKSTQFHTSGFGSQSRT